MTNIGEKLLRAQGSAATGGWDPDRAVMLAGSLFPTADGIDWDEGAGEAWLRVVEEGRVAALVSVKIPLVLALHGRVTTPIPADVVVIEVDDLDRDGLSCSESVLAKVFGDIGRFHVLDPSAFSANDLWYATV